MPLKNIKQTRLLNSIFKHRAEINRRYVMSLQNHNLLQNHYYEAGLWTPWGKPNDCHEGWEYPTSAVKGQFLGHWMSAAAQLVYYEDDAEAGAKLSYVINELEKCQNANGGKWVHSCPEKYLQWALEGRLVGVPHYTIHKTMMGLWDSWYFAKSQKALDILLAFTDYFIYFTKALSQQQMDDLLDLETGGMMEIFANIYGQTQNPKHRELMEKYCRRRLFNPLVEGQDVLTNMHANTTIPEIMGAAKAYEVTGDKYYMHAVKAYWDCAVTNRGYYATGSADSGEIWCPSNDLLERMGVKTQEHCTRYNMIRLAEFLFRHTADVTYADYIERSLYNGILAQQHPETGMPAYHLPIMPGAIKEWGTPTQTFWCCHGSIVQMHAMYPEIICHTDSEGIVISQFIPCEIELDYGKVVLELDTQGGFSQSLETHHTGPVTKPATIKYNLTVHGGEYTIKLRKPWWATSIKINGKNAEACDGFISINETCDGQTIAIELGKEIQQIPLPGHENMVAFMDGPVVLGGLCTSESMPKGNLRPIDTKRWMEWRNEYILGSIRFIPLYEIIDQQYTVYFDTKG